MKRIIALLLALSTVFLCCCTFYVIDTSDTPGDSQTPDIPGEKDDEQQTPVSHTVKLIPSEHVNVSGATEITVLHLQNATFRITFDEGFVFSRVTSGSFQSDTGVLTIPCVSRDMTVRLYAMEIEVEPEKPYLPAIPEIEDPSRFLGKTLSEERLQFAFDEAKKKIDFALPTFTDHSPAHTSVNNVYGCEDNDKVGGWNQGFWTGMLWHIYELTGDEKYKTVCNDHQVPTFKTRIEKKYGVNHHDMGFLFTPSCVASWKLTGNEDAKTAALLAADHLITRYHEQAGFIQAWGSIGDEDSYRLIVDCLMNIPLLYWASEVTGNPKYWNIAYNHFRTTIEVACRADASTYHTYYFDPKTGLPDHGATAQGVSDDSAWARGQAWTMYGSILSYAYTGDKDALHVFKATTNYFLNHLPEDYIAFWDLSFTDGDDEPRDSSANAIALCAMLEGLKYMEEDDPLYDIYSGAVAAMMNSFIDGYITKDIPESNGLLLHATYSKPGNNGVDEMNIWGDYFYMEAIHRLMDEDWEMYW